MPGGVTTVVGVAGGDVAGTVVTTGGLVTGRDVVGGVGTIGTAVVDVVVVVLDDVVLESGGGNGGGSAASDVGGTVPASPSLPLAMTAGTADSREGAPASSSPDDDDVDECPQRGCGRRSDADHHRQRLRPETRLGLRNDRRCRRRRRCRRTDR